MALDGLNFFSDSFLVGSNDEGDGQSSSSDPDWHLAMNAYRSWITAQASRNGNQLSVNITYHVRDFYDWDETDTNKVSGIVSPAELSLLHKAGLAKQCAVYGSVTWQFVWQIGTTWTGEGLFDDV